MADKTGGARLRQAIKNQRDAGEGEFRLTYHDAEEIADEVDDELAWAEDELTRFTWAEGVPTPRDADGEVVPLTTKVMYNAYGEECRIDGFRLSLDPSSSSTWLAGYVVIGLDTGGLVKNLHLRRPDSWEKLEEDINSIKDAACPCDYFNHPDCGMPCYSCPAHTDAEDCIAELARDVLRRARKLAERDAKGAGRG